MNCHCFLRALAVLGLGAGLAGAASRTFVVTDTGQTECFSDRGRMEAPAPGQAFFGQDAQYAGPAMSFRDNGDGTISDLQTGLMWVKTPDLTNKSAFTEVRAGAAACRVGRHTDWRLPTIKELYSLINFSGGMGHRPPRPYLDTRHFDFVFGGTAQGEREIDAQYWSATEYVGRTMRDNATVFGVNFADGRIKGYPRDRTRRGPMTQFVRYVRGNPRYGVNDFRDDGDGTVSDRATGLIWQKADSGRKLNWQQALAYAEGLELAGHADWRLPNAKELQSIVDYSRAPDATDAARRGPAIDPVFQITETESYFWTSTTHLDSPGPRFGAEAVYVCFGRALGNLAAMGGEGGSPRWINVHGAGAQRSDPKRGDPTEPRWASGRGPQGDDVRIYLYVRCVRGGLPGP